MLEKIKKIISEQLSVEVNQITESAAFKEDLGADSLDLFELVMALEEEFEVEIPTEDLNEIAKVEDVVNYLKGKGIE
ncbi:MAG: acyl carrier protein [Anaerocolumna sp.]